MREPAEREWFEACVKPLLCDDVTYVGEASQADALALLQKYGELAAKLGFTPNLGAVQLTDDGDRATVDLAIDAFATIKVNGSMVVAAENGIHWKSIREAARLVKAVAAKSTVRATHPTNVRSLRRATQFRAQLTRNHVASPTSTGPTSRG